MSCWNAKFTGEWSFAVGRLLEQSLDFYEYLLTLRSDLDASVKRIFLEELCLVSSFQSSGKIFEYLTEEGDVLGNVVSFLWRAYQSL